MRKGWGAEGWRRVYHSSTKPKAGRTCLLSREEKTETERVAVQLLCTLFQSNDCGSHWGSRQNLERALLLPNLFRRDFRWPKPTLGKQKDIFCLFIKLYDLEKTIWVHSAFDLSNKTGYYNLFHGLFWRLHTITDIKNPAQRWAQLATALLPPFLFKPSLSPLSVYTHPHLCPPPLTELSSICPYTLYFPASVITLFWDFPLPRCSWWSGSGTCC